MFDIRRCLTGIIRRVLAQKMSVPEAVDRIIEEAGRVGRSLMVDGALRGLEIELCSMGFATSMFTSRTPTREVKERLGGQVLITRKGDCFSDPKDMEHYHYGVIWLTSAADPKAMARKIEKTLDRSDFARNLRQVVKL